MKNKKVKVSKWDASKFLDSDRAIKDYLDVVLEEGNPEIIMLALQDIKKALGVTELSRQTGLTRAGIYKSLRFGGNPSLSTIEKILRTQGLTLCVRPCKTA